MSLTRRDLFKGAAGAAAATLWAGTSSAASDLFGLTPGVHTNLPVHPIIEQARIVGIAQRELGRLGNAIALTDRVGIVNFSKSSAEPRFHIVDMHGGRVEDLFVTHGRGSDPEHDGWLKMFSNEMGSLATSRGAYRTDEFYVGKHGSSMRLHGLDEDNALAYDRAIVVHGAWYADPALISGQGKLGRSEGCFVFAPHVLPRVLEQLGPGRLMFADRL